MVPVLNKIILTIGGKGKLSVSSNRFEELLIVKKTFLLTYPFGHYQHLLLICC